jgi:eukaryotic-like serine/threonine-protein kinase
MPAVGDLLAGRYRIDGVLGAGGMASVYLATDLRLERQVAVKVLLPNLARDPSLAERFDREARILASVTHPSIAEVFDVERGDPATGREPFYVMELCDGGSLADRIATFGPMDPGALVPLIVVVAAALGELHRRGLVHRDVKPANILFTGGRPKLADFGLATSGNRPGYDALTEPGTAIGTPSYMAPELVSGGGATVASDVYALAATTFHGLTGRAPRAADTLSGLATTMTEEIPDVSTVSPRLGAAFDPIVAAALAEDPSARPTISAFTAGLVAALAKEAAVAEPIVAADPIAETTQIAVGGAATRIAPAPVLACRRPVSPRRLPARSIVLAGLLSAAFLIGVLLAIPALFGPRPDATPSAPPTVAPTPTATLAPSPTAAPSPTPTADPAAAAFSALDRVITAINQARGGPDGLSGRDTRELFDLTDKVRSHLQAGDYNEAAADAKRLLDKAEKVTKGLDDQRAQALLDTIESLQAAIPR